ncbi:ribosome maturation factor RimM, partial [Streptomyces sp. SID7982]|nr:ribosome maturation factor RimM [Streptomyces sp. SID7982]
PSQDLFIVERPDGSEVMIPFVEEIVTEIDLEEQRAVITPPLGLIDESEAVIASSRDEETGDAAPGDAASGDPAEAPKGDA